MNKKIPKLSLALLFAAALSVHGSEDEYLLDFSLEKLLETRVSTVSRTSERLDDSPGSVYVITKEIIKSRGYSSLRDVLQVIPGANVFHRDLQYVGMFRGLSANDNEKFALLINGQEMNGVHEPDFLNGPINLDTVEKIEVVVGPSSIFRPANTLVATINVITKMDDTTEVVTSVGSERKYSVSGSGGKTWNENVKVHVSGTIEDRNGFDAWDPNQSVDPMRANAGSKLTGKSVQPDHFVVANGQYHDLSMQLTSYQKDFYELRLPDGDPEPHYTDIMRGFEIKHQHEVNENLTTLLSLSSVYKEMTRSSTEGSWLSLSQIDWNLEAGLTYTGLKKHHLQAGLQLTYEDNLDATFQDVGSPTKQTFYDQDTHGVGFYIDDQFTVNDQLKLVAGLRMDHNDLVKSQWHPSGRAAVIYHATDNWTTKFIFNKSTRMPSPLAALNEIWGLGTIGAPVWAGASPNADKPEELITLEWGNIFYFEDTRVALNLYYQSLTDFITWGSPYSNVGDYDGWGIELSLNHTVNEKISLWGNLSYVDSTFETSGSFDLAANNVDAHQAVDDSDRLIGAPQLTINAGVDANLTESILFSTQLRYFTMQPTEVTEDGGSTFEFEDTNNQLYWDASLVFEDVIKDGLDIRITGKNLLNNRDQVGGPWIRGTYTPRGTALEISTYLEF